MAKSFARASQGRGPSAADLALAKAYVRVFSGEDGEMVLTDLAASAGYFRRPSYGEWIAKTKTPQGFELHSALSNARAEVVQHIMDFLTMSEDRLVELEKAARLESGR